MKITIGDYLLKRLKEVGITKIIGVPGDFNLQFLEQIKKADGIDFVGASNELNAAYAADGYARVNGISALCITYGVGDLGAIAGIAGSYAEHVPVIAISGAPPLHIIRNNYPVHHSLADGNFMNIPNVYDEFTMVQTQINHQNAAAQIDRAIAAAVMWGKPVNIQMPSNLSYFEIEVEDRPLSAKKVYSDPDNLKKAVTAIVNLFNGAKKPAVLIDMDVDRLGVSEKILNFINKSQTPFAQMSTGKGILYEGHTLFRGTYNGGFSKPDVIEFVEGADFLLTVSPRFIEWNSGAFSHDLANEALVNMHKDYVDVAGQVFEAVDIHDVMDQLLEELVDNQPDIAFEEVADEPSFTVEEGELLNHNDFWQQIGTFLKEDDIIYAETGSSSHGLGSLTLPRGSKYIASSIWGAIGFTLPAIFGSMLAAPEKRHLLFIGDGSFQVTAQELSRILYEELNPIIFLINNDGYTIERLIMGMEASYNDIPEWKYADIPELFVKDNKMKTFRVTKQDELAQALAEAEKASHGALIEVLLDKEDAPESLIKHGPKLASFNYGWRGMKEMGEEDRYHDL